MSVVAVCACSTPDPEIVAIEAGDWHTCALLDNGAMRCWGEGTDGKLGYRSLDDIGDDEVPSSAGDVHVGGLVTQVAARAHQSCALFETGQYRCWGLREPGGPRVGDDEAPSDGPLLGLDRTITAIDAGFWHHCTLDSTGAVQCAGDDSFGQLGYGGDDGPRDVPLGGTAVQVATGAVHTCAVLDTGTLRCWGDGSFGMLGYANTERVGDDETPESVGAIDVGGAVVQVATGDLHTCALLVGGRVRCWGFGGDGRLGYGNTDDIGDDETPAQAGDVDVGGTVVQIVAHIQTCALLNTGSVRCWGPGGEGELGYGTCVSAAFEPGCDIGDDETPASVGDVDVGGRAVQLSAGHFHTCALLDTGAARCWGAGHRGRLGYGTCVAGEGDGRCNIGDDETPASAGDVPIP